MGFRDTRYLPFNFQVYRILSILLPGIWDTVFNVFVSFRDNEYLGNITMGIGDICQFIRDTQGIWDIWHRLYKPHLGTLLR